MISLSSLIKWIIVSTRAAGPYFAIALVMPGGCLIALLLWISAMGPEGTVATPVEPPANRKFAFFFRRTLHRFHLRHHRRADWLRFLFGPHTLRGERRPQPPIHPLA